VSGYCIQLYCTSGRTVYGHSRYPDIIILHNTDLRVAGATVYRHSRCRSYYIIQTYALRVRLSIDTQGVSRIT